VYQPLIKPRLAWDIIPDDAKLDEIALRMANRLLGAVASPGVRGIATDRPLSEIIRTAPVATVDRVFGEVEGGSYRLKERQKEVLRASMVRYLQEAESTGFFPALRKARA